MTCANCAMTIERTLNKKVPGVVKASVNFATERAHVEYIPTVTTINDMISAIERSFSILHLASMSILKPLLLSSH